MRFSFLTALTALVSLAYADVEFTKPAAGASEAGGSAFTVTFEDSGDSPEISALASYELFLCAGGSTSGTYTQLYELVSAGTFDSLSVSVTVPVGTGGSTKYAYFLMMISTATAGGTVTNFSKRFTLTGMTGVFSSTVTSGIDSITGDDDVPDTIDDVTDSTATTAATGDPYTVPYYLQTGLTKYAPMQPVPGTKITAKTATPLYPTSSYSIATTYLATASIVLTVTESQTHSVSSVENTVAAAQTRTKDDMGNWLRRWAD